MTDPEALAVALSNVGTMSPRLRKLYDDAAAVLRAQAAEIERLKAHAVTLAETARVVEQQRIAALIATHTGLTLETLEYLQTMREGPSPEEWAELDANARGDLGPNAELSGAVRPPLE